MTALPHNGADARRWERLLFVMLFVGVCALFTGWQVPGLPIEVFDFVCLVAAPLLVAGALMEGKLPRSTGFCMVAIFLSFNAVLAFKLGTGNGIREALQAGLLILFAAVVTLYRHQLDWRRMARWFLFFAAIITAYNIYWHVSNGFIVGWKRLNEPKLLLSYAPPVIFALMLLRRKAGLGAYVLLAGIFVLLVLSGERKSQLAFVVELAILCLVGYTSFAVYAVGALAVAPLLTLIVLSEPYLLQQFNSIFAMGAQTSYTLAEMVDPASSVTISNAQRLFALQVSADLIRQNPFFGLGTNGYQPYLKQVYQYLPSYFLLSIHNEFQRILVENGAVGLALYLLPWLRTVLMVVPVGRLMGRRTAGLYVMFLTVFFLQCFFESSGTSAFLAFILMALMPEFFIASKRATFRWPADSNPILSGGRQGRVRGRPAPLAPIMGRDEHVSWQAQLPVFKSRRKSKPPLRGGGVQGKFY